jgi:hypothetical protein
MAVPPVPNPGERDPRRDLEIKDATLIFNAVWADLIEKHGRDKLRFPREFIWLGGAPGAGKGTNSPFIARPAASQPRRSSSAACSLAHRPSPSRMPARWSATAK